jgi:hypothetical protein
MLTSTRICEMSKMYRWFVAYLWEENISRDFMRFSFSNLYCYWRTRLSSGFGEIRLAEKMGFFLIFGDICIG